MSVDRRSVLATGLLGAGAYTLAGSALFHSSRALAKPGKYKITRTPAQWKKRLGAARYRILRQEGTERAYSSKLNNEKRKGIYACAGCNLGVYASSTKFNSRTGWPSFWAPIARNRIGTSVDFKIGYRRTEVHCSRCGGHLGHIFNDGPKPTGKRHCLNGLALKFIPA